MLIFSSTHTFTFPGGETLLLVWSGLWFISKSRDTQLGKVYFSGKVPTTGLANVTCLHISRQVQLFSICFSFLTLCISIVMLHCDVNIFISQILLSRKASSQSSLLHYCIYAYIKHAHTVYNMHPSFGLQFEKKKKKTEEVVKH